MRYNIKRKSLLFLFSCLLLLLTKLSFARIQNEIVTEAELYKNFTWVPSTNNILDTKDHKNNLTIKPPPDGQDGIDDRRFSWDSEKNKWIELDKNWPFIVNSTYTGEAYAWFYDPNNSDLGGVDTLTRFEQKITATTEKWIAGSRSIDTIPSGYDGFAGVDCSGFITKLWHYNDPYGHLGTGLLGDYCIEIELSKMKKGDIFVKPPWLDPDNIGHAILFIDWITTAQKAKIIHSVSKRFTDGTHVRRIIDDVATIKVIDQKVYINEYGNDRRYIPYSPFPQFSNQTPAHRTSIDTTRAPISCVLESGTPIDFSGVTLTLNGVTKTLTFETISAVHPYKYKVSYTPGLGELQRGTINTVCVTAMNNLSLQDSTTWIFTISEQEIQPPDTVWPGTLVDIDTTTSPGDLRLAKGWITQTVVSVSPEGDFAEYPALAIDSNNHPHITFYQYYQTGNYMHYAKWTGTKWQIERNIGTSGYGEFNPIAIDNNNKPHIAYFLSKPNNYRIGYVDKGGYGISSWIDAVG
ncbi:MAG: hypothetical protein QME68_06480, partial [Elusimicrobiota bacterium]|nr:hypothetical protein [Elusimicrobiota bacterium]